MLVGTVAALAALGVLDGDDVASIATVVVVLALLEWAAAPAIVKWAIPARIVEHDGTRYLTDEPIGEIVARRCRDAGVPLVTLGIVDDGVPNAFAFGRTRRDAHVYVTRGLLERLDEREVDAVVAHELGHVRHLDFVLMTMALMVPLVLYVIGRLLVDIDADDDDADEGSGAALAGAAVLVLWLVSEFVVLWLSRSRELAADHWSCECTGDGDALVSALVKVGYGMSLDAAARDGEESEHRHRDRASARMRALGIFDGGATGAMANGFAAGLDVDRALAAVRWEARNPWARVHEKMSTHPLVGRRIAVLEASGLPGSPTVFAAAVAADRATSDDGERRRLWWAFAADVAAVVLPWTLLVTSLLALCGGAVSWETGVALAGAGAGFAVAQCRRYPFPHVGVDEVTSLLGRMDAGPVHGIPVEARGRIVGRDTPGFVLSADLVLQDGSGLVALDYRQPIPFADALFGFRKAEQFIDEEVVVRGWYRRTPNPVIELRELATADGRTVRPGLWITRFVLAGAVIAAGLAVTVVHLATTGGV